METGKDKVMKFEDMINTIINDDCLNILKQIPDKSIDLILTDPPYRNRRKLKK